MILLGEIGIRDLQYLCFGTSSQYVIICEGKIQYPAKAWGIILQKLKRLSSPLRINGNALLVLIRNSKVLLLSQTLDNCAKKWGINGFARFLISLWYLAINVRLRVALLTVLHEAFQV